MSAAPFGCRAQSATLPVGAEVATPAADVDPATVAVSVRPAIGTDSKRAENLSSASDPHRLAVVVSQAPRRCRARLPTTMRGRSSFHAGSSSTARMSRAALASALSISHHQKSLSSVLKRSVVPAYVRRARRICCASSRRLARDGMAGTRLSTLSQSITAAVGHVFGTRLIEPSCRG